MENQSNGAAVKNGTTKEIIKNVAINGTAKNAPATEKPNGETVTPAKPEPAKPQTEIKPRAETLPEKPELTLDAKLKAVNELHRRSVQRLNLISRIQQLETFEITLAQQNDELEENPYQGCKLNYKG